MKQNFVTTIKNEEAKYKWQWQHGIEHDINDYYTKNGFLSNNYFRWSFN